MAEILEISKSGRIYSSTLSLQELLSELTKRRKREKRENGGEKREYERKEIKREKKREMGEKKDVPKMCRS